MNDKKKDKKIIEERVFDFTGEDLQIEEREGQSPKIVFYPAVFNKWSEDLGYFREKILPGAFDDVLQDDVRGVFNHDPNLILGRTKSGTMKLEQNQKGLKATITPPDTQLANDLIKLIKRGDVSQGSFKFTILEQEWKWSENPEKLDERTIKKIGRLYDASIVTYPAYPDTTAYLRSSNAEQVYQRAKEETKPEESTIIEPVQINRNYLVNKMQMEQDLLI